MGKLISDAGVDFILVGDSLGTTLLGYDTTIPVTIDDMVRHTSAVRRSDQAACWLPICRLAKPACLLTVCLNLAGGSCRRGSGCGQVGGEIWRTTSRNLSRRVFRFWGISVFFRKPSRLSVVTGSSARTGMKRKASTPMQSVWKRRGVLPSLPRWSRAKWLPSWPNRLLRPLLASEADRTAMGRFWLPMICLG